MRMGTMDLSELYEFQKKLKELRENKLDDFMNLLTRQLAQIVLSKAIFRTPVLTGDLKRGWTGGTEIGPTAYVKTLPVVVNKKRYKMLLSNDMHYASYVEYGHRTRAGMGLKASTRRKKAVVGSDGKMMFVPGMFMAKKAVDFAKSNFNQIAQIELERFIRENLDV